MKPIKQVLMSSLHVKETKCEFTSLCNLYSNSSYTCTHVGGIYCGKYRKLQTTKNNIPREMMGFIENQ